MTLEADLQDTMLDGYRQTGEALGYWAERFRQAVVRNGGLATAKRMLLPRNKQQRSGLDRLLEANRADLSIESLVLSPRFSTLFTPDEKKEAEDRLAGFAAEASRLEASRENLFPDELRRGQTYPEGAKKQVLVNAFERDARARKACIALFGSKCAVCDFDFESVYGELGHEFIHVHHRRPMASISAPYKVDPETDLIPVCPNCHAMLHRPKDRVLDIEELRNLINSAK
jgi:5-methylcytosine-specific restriction enzyme A